MDFTSPQVAQQQNTSATVGQMSSTTPSAKNPASMFARFINWCLYALIVLIPVIFLPFTSEFREFNKQAVLVYGVLLLAGGWMIKVLISRRLGWRRTTLDFAVLTYLLIYIAASALSVDKASSFLGYINRYTGSAISLIALGLLYFAVVNNVRYHDTIKKAVNMLLIGSGLTLVYGLLQIFGLYIFGSPTHAPSFNTIGSMVALAIFSAVSVVFYQWLNLAQPSAATWKKVVLGVLSLIGLIVLFMASAITAWVVLLVGTVVLLTLGSSVFGANNSHSWFWQPMLVLVISVLFVAFSVLPASLNPRRLVKTGLPVEIQLSAKSTLNLVKNSYSNAKQAVIGSGPGTTGIIYGQIKPESLNKTIVWSLTFDRSSSEIGNIAIETGILGLIAFEGLAIMFLIFALKFLRKQDGSDKSWALGFFLIWSMLYVSHFVYFFSTTAMFLYWLSMALFVTAAKQTSSANEPLTQQAPSGNTVSWMAGSIVILAVILVGLFFQSTVYVAEAAYTSGLKMINQKDPDYAAAGSSIVRAANLNPYRDNYRLALGQDEIFLASIEAAKKDANVQLLSQEIQAIIANGEKATKLSPAKASNWSAKAQFYAAIAPLGIKGANDKAIEGWQGAVDRDPKNPVLLVRLAQAYVNGASSIDTELLTNGTDTDKDGLVDEVETKLGSNPNDTDTNKNGVTDGNEVRAGLNPVGKGNLTKAQAAVVIKQDASKFAKAEEALNKAIVLKNDLPDSYIALARVLEQENKLDDARKTLDDAAGKFPYNADVKYEQGRIAFNQGKTDDAVNIFNDVLKLSPNHANATYSLGLTDLVKGNKDAALTHFEKARDISGPNVNLDKLIDNLKNPPAAPSK